MHGAHSLKVLVPCGVMGVRKSAKQLDSSGEESDIPDEPPLKKAKHRVYLPLMTNNGELKT